jgi:formylglycine-generating enzyme required for sulfatase activity
MDILRPMEYFADTSELIRMLRTGHHNVQPDREAWERLYTWIDLNAPYRGAWKPGEWRGCNQVQRRLELAKQFAGNDCSPEEEYDRLVTEHTNRSAKTIMPDPQPERERDSLIVPGFPFDAEQAAEMQADGQPVRFPLSLGNGYTVTMVRIPAGSFVMGSETGYADEQPRAVITIDKPFWMSETEISNGQYEQYDPEHDTRYIDEHGKDQAVPGYIANHVDQPVARVSWREAMRFCTWLSGKTGKKVSLPTEAQWEWAARGGTDSQFYYGDVDTDFSEYANLSDHSVLYRATGWDGGSMIHIRRKYNEDGPFPLRENRYNDGCMVVNYVGQYHPNAWGLKDMAGNVCELTLSDYRPYPYDEYDGRNDADSEEMKTARGGSWNDRPKSAGASVRCAHQPYQKVYNVGFRIIIEGGVTAAVYRRD